MSDRQWMHDLCQIEPHPMLILERKPQIKSVENNTKNSFRLNFNLPSMPMGVKSVFYTTEKTVWIKGKFHFVMTQLLIIFQQNQHC